MQDYIFTLECDERPGILHSVTGALLTHGGDIKELKQFDDQYTQRLFLRIDFRVSDEPGNGIGGLRKDFESLPRSSTRSGSCGRRARSGGC